MSVSRGVRRWYTPGTSGHVAEEARTEGQQPDADRTPVYRQLWFFVLIAIVLGIAFGLLFEEQALKAQ
jgi:hypothetical protein